MIHRRKLYQIIAMLLLCTMLIPTAAHATQTTDGALDETNDTIENLENHKEEQLENLKGLETHKIELSDSIAELNNNLQDITDSLEDLQIQMDDLNTQIAEKESRIEELNQQIAVMYDDMTKRIRYTYEYGSNSYLNALLEAESFTDFLNRAEYVKAIHDYDSEQVETYELMVTQVQHEQDELESSKEELTAAQEEQKTKREEADVLVAQQQSQLAVLDSNINNVQDDVKDRKSVV